MALNRSLFICGALVFACAIAGIFADAGVQEDSVLIQDNAQLDRENLQLQKQVAELESRLAITDSNLKQARQESIDKSRRVVALENEVDTLQKRSSGDLESKLQFSEAKAEDSAKQVVRLQEALKNLEQSILVMQKKLDSSEAKLQEQTLKYSQAEKTISSLRKKLRDAEEALRISEGLMLKAESEAAAKAQELYKIYEAWLPPWAASRLAQLQTTAAGYWAVHGDPVYKSLSERACQRVNYAKEFVKPHVDSLKKKVIPAAKEYLDKGCENGKIAASKVSEGYKTHVFPHIEKAKKHVSPHVQVVRDRVRPHVDKAAVIIRPYFDRAAPLFATFQLKIQATRKYRQRVEKSVQNLLLKHESSAAWAASKELVTFLALAVVTLPAIAMILLIRSSFSSKKVTKPSRSSHNSHKKHRRVKQTSSSS